MQCRKPTASKQCKARLINQAFTYHCTVCVQDKLVMATCYRFTLHLPRYNDSDSDNTNSRTHDATAVEMTIRTDRLICQEVIIPMTKATPPFLTSIDKMPMTLYGTYKFSLIFCEETRALLPIFIDKFVINKSTYVSMKAFWALWSSVRLSKKKAENRKNKIICFKVNAFIQRRVKLKIYSSTHFK